MKQFHTELRFIHTACSGYGSSLQMECGELGSSGQYSDWAMGLTIRGLFPGSGKTFYSSKSIQTSSWELTLLIMGNRSVVAKIGKRKIKGSVFLPQGQENVLDHTLHLGG